MNSGTANLALGIWSLFWIGAAAVIAYRGRDNRLKAAGWLIAIGAFLAALEAPALVLWLASVVSGVDRDGALSLVRPHLRGHMYGAGVFALVALVLSIWIARTVLRRGERWAWQALLTVLIFAGGTDLVELVFIYPDGFPLTTAAGGVVEFGWPPLFAWIGLWAFALWYCRRQLTRTANA